MTLPVAIYQYMEWNLDATVSAVSALLVLMAAMSMLVVERSIGLGRFIGLRGLKAARFSPAAKHASLAAAGDGAAAETVEEPDMRSKILRCAFGAALAAGVAGAAGASLADEIVLATWGGKFGKLFQEDLGRSLRAGDRPRGQADLRRRLQQLGAGHRPEGQSPDRPVDGDHGLRRRPVGPWPAGGTRPRRDTQPVQLHELGRAQDRRPDPLCRPVALLLRDPVPAPTRSTGR